MTEQNTDQNQPGQENEEKKASDDPSKDEPAVAASSSGEICNPAPGDVSNNNQDVKESEDIDLGEEELVDERKENTLDCYYIGLALVLGAILLGVLVYFAVSSLKESPMAVGNVTEMASSTDFNPTHLVTEPTVLTPLDNTTHSG